MPTLIDLAINSNKTVLFSSILCTRRSIMILELFLIKLEINLIKLELSCQHLEKIILIIPQIIMRYPIFYKRQKDKEFLFIYFVTSIPLFISIKMTKSKPLHAWNMQKTRRLRFASTCNVPPNIYQYIITSDNG